MKINLSIILLIVLLVSLVFVLGALRNQWTLDAAALYHAGRGQVAELAKDQSAVDYTVVADGVTKLRDAADLADRVSRFYFLDKPELLYFAFSTHAAAASCNRIASDPSAADFTRLGLALVCANALFVADEAYQALPIKTP